MNTIYLKRKEGKKSALRRKRRICVVTVGSLLGVAKDNPRLPP